MSASIIRADARSLPLPDASVDLIITSPPYFRQRSYTDGGEHYGGQIGAEATPREYVAALLDCTREWVRVLKPSGSLFVNLGDKYATRYSSQRTAGRAGLNGDDDSRGRSGQNTTGAPEKSLIGLPWRYALACIDDLGLILRSEVIWAKPNGLPESVTDRVRRSHEQLFHFTRQPRYYSAVDAIREEHCGPWKSPGGARPAAAVGPQSRGGHSQHDRSRAERDETARHPLGKLPGSVWEIAAQPLTVPASLDVDHFAAFPMELPRRCILGWSPPGICTACGEGRRPVSVGERTNGKHGPVSGAAWNTGAKAETATGHGNTFQTIRTLTGYACACPDTTAATRPAVVLDPFGGTGTTALLADVNGRHGISVDMSADYCRIARWRTADPRQRDRAAGRKPRPVRKPRAQVTGQAMLSLFDVPGASA